MGTAWMWCVLGLRAGVQADWSGVCVCVSMDRNSWDGWGPRAASVPAAERRMSTLGILGEGCLPPSCPFWIMGEILCGSLTSDCVVVEWQVCE